MTYWHLFVKGINWIEKKCLVECLSVLFTLQVALGLTMRWNRFSAGLGIALVFFSGVWLKRLVAARKSATVDQYGGKSHLCFKLELLSLCILFFFLQLSGGTSSYFYPLLYLLLFVICSFDQKAGNRAMIVTIAIGWELLAGLLKGAFPYGESIVRLVVIGSLPLLGGMLAKRQSAKQPQTQKKMDCFDGRPDVIQEAPYQLRESTWVDEGDGVFKERRRHLKDTPMRHLDVSIGNILSMLKTSMNLQTIAVYWLTEDKGRLRQMNSLTDTQVKLRQSVQTGQGVIGAILRGKGAITMHGAQLSNRLLAYYPRKVCVGAFGGVPLVAGGQDPLVGVMLADREADIAFRADDEKTLQMAAREILRIWNMERMLNRMEQIRNEATGLYNATQGLIEALSLQEVLGEVAESFRKVYGAIDLAVVLLQANDDGPLVIKAVSSSEHFASWGAANLNKKISPADNLCVLSMHKNMIIPETAYDRRIQSRQRIFGSQIDPPGIKSVKVVPLKLAASEVDNIGIIVLASRTPTYFPERGERAEDVKRTLETISNIAAIGIQNARRYERLEELATLDALTGLYNRRRLFEILDQEIAAAKRYAHPLSLILADIDNFKQVNDTYGHPMGDQVLKTVAKILSQEARETDKLFRYGGEEFAVLMPHTNKEGGLLLGERFRKLVKQQKFHCKGREFAVTISFGICTLPVGAEKRSDLINHADQALYHAKKAGRDRVIHYGDIV